VVEVKVGAPGDQDCCGDSYVDDGTSVWNVGVHPQLEAGGRVESLSYWEEAPRKVTPGTRRTKSPNLGCEVVLALHSR
jgi:hypothetical protein